jgi:hypothetical protein
LTRSNTKGDPRQDKPKSRLKLGSRILGLAKGQFGGLFWRALAYAVPILGLGAYTTALNNLASKYVTQSNGNWIIGKGADILSLGNNPALPGRVATGVEGFILTYAYKWPIVQVASILVLVILVELLLFRRRRRHSIQHRH